MAKTLAELESPIDENGRHLSDKLFAVTKNVYITLQQNNKDAYWEQKFGIKGFKSAGTGGDGDIVAYNGVLTKSLFAHEAGHNLALAHFGTSTPPPDSDFGKIRAKWEKDKNAESPIMDYGKTNVAED